LAGGASAESRGLVGARAAALAAATPAHVTAARIEETGDLTRLTFAISAPVAPDAFVLADPDRAIIDLPNVDFALDPRIGHPARARRGHPAPVRLTSLVASYRFGLLGPGKSRIVIDLAAPVRIEKASVGTSQTGGTELVIDLARTDRATFKAAVQAGRAGGREVPPADRRADATVAEKPEALPVIVLDPGHGGVDSGAMVNGLVEKTIVFDFAKALAAKLTASGHFTVKLTRDEDTFIPLAERVRLAREDHASLFVSIHADTLSEPSVTGATIYTVSDRASDAEAARVAEKENQADAAAGLESGEDGSGVSDILFDLTRRETRAYSHVFARMLVAYWKSTARLNKNPERSAGFKVLKAPDVPSVLLELGYLSSDKDAAALTSEDWRDKASARVADAIIAFFDGREPVPDSAAARTVGRLATGTTEPPPVLKPGLDTARLTPVVAPDVAPASH